MYDAMVLRRETYESIREIANTVSADAALDVYNAIFEYAFNRKLPSTKIGKAILPLVQNTIEKDQSRLKGEQARNSSQYREWREAVLKRDRHTCQRCGADNITMHAHHIKPYAKYPSLRFDVTNGITLCAECHKRVHKDGITDE